MRHPSAAFITAIAGLCLPAPAAVAHAAAAGVPRNVVLIVTDDQRPDTVRALGNLVIRTPNLDWLVEHGTAFTRAVSPNPLCTPARAELMTGLSGFRSGVLGFGEKLPEGAPLWAETMRKAGWHTWYVGKWHNDKRPTDHGYEETLGLFAGGGGKFETEGTDWAGRPVTGYRGWVFQNDARQTFPERGVGLTPDISGKFADAAIEFVERKPQKPFFLHLNFTAPHDPLLIPPGYENAYSPEDVPFPANFLPEHPFDHGNLKGRDELLFAFPRTEQEVRGELAAYYAVISHMDEQVGRLLDALRATDQLDETLIIFTSDHGLAVGSHGLRGKQSMYEHTVGIPLIFCGPGVPQNTRSNAQCYLRDLYPTVCDLAGVRAPRTLEGKSLKPVLDGRLEQIHEQIYGNFRDSQRMIRTDEWKLIHYPQIDRWQLFHLPSDPLERNDLSEQAEHARTLGELKADLKAWLTRQKDPLLSRAPANGAPSRPSR